MFLMDFHKYQSICVPKMKTSLRNQLKDNIYMVCNEMLKTNVF